MDCVWVTHTLDKYAQVERGQDRDEVNSIIDLVLVKKDMLHYVQDEVAVRGMGKGLSDHYVVYVKSG